MHREPVPREQWPSRAHHEHFILEGASFPTTKDDLVDFVTEAEPDLDTLNLVRALPNRVYTDRNDVWRAISEGTRVMMGSAGSPRDDLGKAPNGVDEPA